MYGFPQTVIVTETLTIKCTERYRIYMVPFKTDAWIKKERNQRVRASIKGAQRPENIALPNKQPSTIQNDLIFGMSA